MSWQQRERRVFQEEVIGSLQCPTGDKIRTANFQWIWYLGFLISSFVTVVGTHSSGKKSIQGKEGEDHMRG